MEELLEEYKKTDNYDKKLQILGISPYSIRNTAKLFNATEYMVRKSVKLKKQFGIIPAVPHMSKGKVISKETQELITAFYQTDEISRLCPGKKDCVSVRNLSTGSKELIQKRLILMNLKEVFAVYKENSSNPVIGFSSFAKLRPKFCILAGASGTHSVCVCTYHQNAKLQISALGVPDADYKTFMKKTVCDMENQNCMMHKCKECPREQGLKDYLHEIELLQEKDTFTYKQWVTVDRCNLIEKCESTDEFTNSLSERILKLTRHHYVSKKQSEYFKNLKTNLKENEIIILLDFSENYSFVIQDEVQGFHWENSQCTVHPFVVYHKDIEGTLIPTSYCFLSPDTKHSTAMVYTFLSILLPEIKTKFPHVTKVHYFSDGCAGQYKNRFNFLNVYYHKEDFGLDCEWHFFATSHGKSSCDGVGGAVKRETARASLQRPFNNQILTAEDMYKFCQENLNSKIKFFFTTKEIVKEKEDFLTERFKSALQILGTQKLHKIIPYANGKVKIFDISGSENFEERQIIKKSSLQEEQELLHPTLGSYIVCTYNEKKWIGFVESFEEEFNDYKINFLHPSDFRHYYYYPENKDSCYVPMQNIIKILKDPTLRARTSRIQYCFSKEELQIINAP